MATEKKDRPFSRRRFLGNLARGSAGLTLAAAASACDPGTYWDYLTLNEVEKVNDRFNESRSGYGKPLIFPTTNSTKFSFLWVSDVHITFGKPDLMDKLGAYAKQVGPDLVFHSGDCVDDGKEVEFEKWVELMATYIPAPVFSALGNHDLYGDGWDMFKKYLGPSSYRFKYGPCDFIFIDTAAGTLGLDQMNWLEKILENGNLPHRFIFSHYPIYDGGFQTPGSMGNTEERMKLISLMNDNNVAYYLCGHKHTGARYKLRDVTAIIGGAGSPNKQIIADTPHFYHFEINGGQIKDQKIHFSDVELT